LNGIVQSLWIGRKFSAMERLSIASFLALRTGRRTGGLDDCEALDPENRKEINEIRRRGQKLVLDRHLVEHRAKQIDDVFG